MGAVSLLYVSAWIPVLTGLPFSRAGQYRCQDSSAGFAASGAPSAGS